MVGNPTERGKNFMNIKRIAAIVFSCGLIASTCAISVAAYDHTYVSGYDFTTYGTVNKTKVFNMDCWQNSGYIITRCNNKAGVSTYMSVGVAVYNKSTNACIKDKANNGVCANNKYRQTQCTDYRSISTNVYYKHDCTIYGDTTGKNLSSKIASRVDTVG